MIAARALLAAALLFSAAPVPAAEGPVAVEVRAVRKDGPDAGKPVAGASAAVVRVEGEGPFDPDAILSAGPVAAGEDGVARLVPPPGAGRLLAAATAPGFSPALAWVPESGPAEVRLSEGGLLEIAVVASRALGSDAAAPEVPIAGARVTLRPAAGYEEEDAPRAVRSALAGEDGRARIADLARGPLFEAEARAPGWAPGRASHLLAGGAPQSVGLEPAARVAGRVIRVPGGGPLAGARVRAGGDEAISGPDGRFALESLGAGVFDLEASADGTVALDRPVVQAVAGATVEAPDLRLATLGRVRVLVQDADGKGVERVPVRLLPADGAARLPGPPPAGLTGSGGLAVLAPIAPGAGHRLVIDPPARFAPRVTPAFAVLAGEVADLGTMRLDAGGVVSGTVAGPDGAPVEGATLAIVDGETDPLRAAADPAAGGPLRRDLDLPADGRFRVDRVPAGTVTLLARAPGRLPAASTRIRVEVGKAAKEVALVLKPGATVAGRLRDAAGEPVVDALLVALVPPTDRESGRARTGPGGLFRLEGLAPGEVRLRILLPEETFPDPLRAPFVAVAPSEGNEIRLPATAALEGVVVDPGGGPVVAQVAVLRLEAGPAGGPLLEIAREVDRVRAAEDGAFATRPLPEGRWRLRAEAPDGRVAAADVAVGDDDARPIVLRLAAGTTVKGTVVTGDAVRDPRQVSLRLLLGGRAESAVPPSAVEPGGGFSIHGVPPGEHDLVVSVPGLAPLVLRAILVPPEGGVVDLGPILLGRGASLRLRVLGETRAPVDAAAAAVVDPTGFRREETTNSAGLAIFGGLAAGPHLVEVRLPSGILLRRPVTAPADGEFEETIDLGEDPPGTVSVRRSGVAVPGAAVRILDAARGAGSYAASVEVVADGNGLARLPALPEGPVLVEVTPPGEPPVRLPVTASRGILDVILPDDGIEGEVRAAEDGRAIPGAVVRAWALDGGGGDLAEALRTRGVAATADARGRFRFPSLPPGRWVLEAAARGRGAERVGSVRVLRGGGAILVEILLEAAARVRGAVRDSGGGPVPGAVVEATDPDTGELRPGGRRTADASGSYDFEGLAPGPVILTARAGGLGASPPELVALAPGEERARDLHIWPGGTLEVTVVSRGGKAVADAEVEVHDFFGVPVPPPDAPGGVTAPVVGLGRTGADGVLRLPGLRAGVYTVRATAGELTGAVRVRVDARSGARTAVAVE